MGALRGGAWTLRFAAARRIRRAGGMGGGITEVEDEAAEPAWPAAPPLASPVVAAAPPADRVPVRTPGKVVAPTPAAADPAAVGCPVGPAELIARPDWRFWPAALAEPATGWPDEFPEMGFAPAAPAGPDARPPVLALALAPAGGAVPPASTPDAPVALEEPLAPEGAVAPADEEEPAGADGPAGAGAPGWAAAAAAEARTTMLARIGAVRMARSWAPNRAAGPEVRAQLRPY